MPVSRKAGDPQCFEGKTGFTFIDQHVKRSGGWVLLTTPGCLCFLAAPAATWEGVGHVSNHSHAKYVVIACGERTVRACPCCE